MGEAEARIIALPRHTETEDICTITIPRDNLHTSQSILLQFTANKPWPLHLIPPYETYVANTVVRCVSCSSPKYEATRTPLVPIRPGQPSSWFGSNTGDCFRSGRDAATPVLCSSGAIDC